MPEIVEREKFEIILKAMREQKLLHFRYMDVNGKVTDRQVEPYEIKGFGMYALDPAKGAIRQFKIARMGQIQVVEQKFEPKYPIRVSADK
jgi:predicted DNA-binding transcriptional regulator YafY